MSEDIVVACMDLIGRAGAVEGRLEWTCPHTPGAPDDHSCEAVTWAVTAVYKGARIVRDGYRTPGEAAYAMAERILNGATCRCGEPVTLNDDGRGCRWRLAGPKWSPSCDAPPFTLQGERGNPAALQRAVPRQNRAQRRAQARRRDRGR